MFLEIEYKGVSKVSNQMISGRASVKSDGDVYRIRGEEIIPCTLCKAIPLKTEPQYFENDMVLIEGVVHTIKFGTINITELLDPEDLICDDFHLTCFYLDGPHGKKPLNLDNLRNAHYVGNKWMTNVGDRISTDEISATINSLINNHAISPESKMTLLKTLNAVKEMVDPQPVVRDMLCMYVGQPVYLKTDKTTNIVIFQELGEEVRFSDITLPLSTYGQEWTICPYTPNKNVSCWA